MIQQHRHSDRQPDFHGAAMVDDQGREIPITEDMIRQALTALVGAPLTPPAHPED